MRKNKGCGLAPVNKLKLVAPNRSPLIMLLPRCSHPAPPYISNTFPRQCLRRVFFRLDQIAKVRVWIYTEPNRVESYWGPSFPRLSIRGPNCIGSNCSEANCQELSCPGPNIVERLHKAELSRADSSEPSFPNTKYWKHISRKAVHVVILGVTIAKKKKKEKKKKKKNTKKNL